MGAGCLPGPIHSGSVSSVCRSQPPVHQLQLVVLGLRNQEPSDGPENIPPRSVAACPQVGLIRPLLHLFAHVPHTCVNWWLVIRCDYRLGGGWVVSGACHHSQASSTTVSRHFPSIWPTGWQRSSNLNIFCVESVAPTEEMKIFRWAGNLVELYIYRAWLGKALAGGP